jgi:hypothetical protein
MKFKWLHSEPLEFEILSIIEEHHISENAISYKVKYMLRNGMTETILIWGRDDTTEEELKEAIIKYERGKKMKLEKTSTLGEKELIETAKEYNIEIVLVRYRGGDFYEIFYNYYHDSGITKDSVKVKGNEEINDIIQYIIRIENIQNRYKKVGQSNSDLLKQLLDSPRVESIAITHERVGETEHTEIQAKLKEGENE